MRTDDGVRLGYRRLGQGPPVLLWHGGLITSHHLMVLAGHLARAGFEVWVPDRRGRGLSGGVAPRRVGPAARDVAALVEHTGARRLFGLSAGAVPVLEWARQAGPGCAVALYEPPLGAALSWLPDFEERWARGERAAALAAVVRGTEDAPWMRRVPRSWSQPLMALALRVPAPEGVGAQLESMGADAHMVRSAAPLLSRADSVRGRVLLLGGARSPAYLGRALDTLEGVVPGVERVRLAGVGHLAATNDGRPASVARPLVEFFTPDP
ncbi:alpha/beta fold hydrolase [Nocardiopsis sp. MG754419]|uniref:alpha/beta fold hydrolase n=1 Tax=Nocardiopsis sp. MG754419 TaxID=2259865 RepID=UPI0027DE1B80|nr:alpha/beta fold hydrolase [Nocardiopsis sp. MG754419]